jgi:hypothetical protein
MVRSVFIKWLSLAAICLHLFSCQVMEEVDGSQKEGTSLKIKARSLEAVSVPYPLSLYAFDGQGRCSASQKIVNGDDRIELVLSVGNYRIVAIAGYSDEYLLPEEPTMDEVISLERAADVPLMMGEESVEITGEEDVTMEIALSYVVAGVNPMYDLTRKKQAKRRPKPFNVYLEMGLGCDFYLPFFKLIPELKFSFGLADILQKNRPDLTDPTQHIFTESLDGASANMVTLSFYFE